MLCYGKGSATNNTNSPQTTVLERQTHYFLNVSIQQTKLWQWSLDNSYGLIAYTWCSAQYKLACFICSFFVRLMTQFIIDDGIRHDQNDNITYG